MTPTDPTTTDAPLVRMADVTKRFGRVTVLEGVSFDVRPGEVHILAGENGAGKSTLMKILGGVHADFEGTLEVGGRPMRFRSPLEANAAGVAVIYQELSLVPAMTVAENIFLGRNLTAAGGFVRAPQQRAAARNLLGRLGLDELDVDARVERLPVGQQQLVEIAKAMAQDARVVVMDEPTSSLTAPEVAKLFALVDDLKRRGCGVVYISHKMEEIERVADRITVLRDGKHVGTAAASELPVAKLIQWMVGRTVEEQYGWHANLAAGGRPLLEVKEFTAHDGRPNPRPPVDGVSLTVGRGEVVGIGGLQGSGASELLLGLFGAYGPRAVNGAVTLDGEPFNPSSPRASIAAGVALLTNDRKATGLVLPLSVLANATLAALGKVSPAGWRSDRRERQMTLPLTGSLRLRAPSLDVDVSALSGGNQQKVAIAKWLATEPKLLLLDEPTRGIDIGAKRDIYRLIDEWTARGIGVLLITSEMPELLALSDRVMVMHRGRVTAELRRGEATPERVLTAAMGEADTAFGSKALADADAAVPHG